MRCVPIGHFASGHCPHINLGRSGSDSGPMSISNNLVIHYQEVKSTANKKMLITQGKSKSKTSQSMEFADMKILRNSVVCTILVSFQPLTHSTKFYCKP